MIVKNPFAFRTDLHATQRRLSAVPTAIAQTPIGPIEDGQALGVRPVWTE